MSDSIMMIRPLDAGFNEETAKDNEFMKQNENQSVDLESKVLIEFDKAVEQIRDQNIEVIVIDYSEMRNSIEKLPDATFPNNWISTNEQGDIILYPMYAKSRENEKKLFDLVKAQLFANNRKIKSVREVQRIGQQVLEGTGSIIIDHKLRKAYCSESHRSSQTLFLEWCKSENYKPVFFHAFSVNGKPIYHTNVILSIGDDYALICKEAIPEQEREHVIDELKQSRTLIEIDNEQMQNHFCGNILEVKNREGQKFIIMSQTAYQGFRQEQIKLLESLSGPIIPIQIDLIEQVGGGSARCMLAEIFLPRSK